MTDHPHDEDSAMGGRRPFEGHPSGLEPGDAARLRRRRQWLVLGAVVMAVALVAAFGSFGLSRDPGQVPSGMVGKPAPDLSLARLDGSGTVDLSELRGQVVVVNFWASWCRPCLAEHPGLLAAWERFRDRGVVFVGVLYQDSSSNALAYQREHGGDWPLVDDPKGSAALAFGVFGVPETFFVGADGRVGFKQVGATSYEVLTQQINRLLGERSR